MQEKMTDKFKYENYNQMNALMKIEEQNKEKLENFMQRIQAFKDVNTLEEAKELASKILPVSNEINSFKIGNARCTVVNKENSFRISIDTKDEFISYDFV